MVIDQFLAEYGNEDGLRPFNRVKHDLPMDHTDATIVCVAVDLGITAVVTLDRRHFSVYRIGSRRFNIMAFLAFLAFHLSRLSLD